MVDLLQDYSQKLVIFWENFNLGNIYAIANCLSCSLHFRMSFWGYFPFNQMSCTKNNRTQLANYSNWIREKFRNWQWVFMIKMLFIFFYIRALITLTLKLPLRPILLIQRDPFLHLKNVENHAKNGPSVQKMGHSRI